MKLYTEEQIQDAYLSGRLTTMKFEEVIKLYTPIELPSDEEIKKEAPFGESTFGFEQGRYQGFIVGAKWMKKQILNQNK